MKNANHRSQRLASTRRKSQTLGALKRLPLVAEGIEQGKSHRQIGRELNVDKKTISRDLKKLALPQQDLDRIASGHPAEPILKAEAMRQAKIIEQARIGAAFADERSVNLCTELILEWLSLEPLLPVDKAMLLREAEPRLHRMGSTGRCAVAWKDAWSAIDSSKPTGTKPVESFEVINWLAIWLMRWLPQVEPVRDLRSNAVEKAIRFLDAKSRSW